MTATIVDGRPLADRMLRETHEAVEHRLKQGLRRPCLAIVMAGRNPGALAYARRQSEFAGRAGIEAVLHNLAEDAGQAEAEAMIATLSADDAVDGVMPLFPFPAHIDVLKLLQVLNPAKDVDGLTAGNAGRLAVGLDGHVPCTPQAAITLAEHLAGDLRGRLVTVVGASIRVGRPLAQLLLSREATVTIAHAATIDLAAACRTAEVLFVAAGRAGLITGAHLRPGAVVMDIGINQVDAPDLGEGAKRIVGDVDLASAGAVASSISAAPDGVGPLTTAWLMSNTLRAAGPAH
jgi:methylenetetrahydrofolate dehydrogenase (NADP+) / methenyltetrahydrofolate cyclohydrolase